MFTRTIIYTTKEDTRTNYNCIKVTDMTEHMIPVDAYGFYTIVHGKPRPIQRLRWTVTVGRGGAYSITGTVLCILTRFRWN